MGVAVTAGFVWCGACVAFCVRAGCFGRFKDLDELSSGGVRGGSFGIASAEELGGFEGEKVGFGDGVDGFGFRPGCVKEKEDVEREFFMGGGRCGWVRDGCGQDVGYACRLQACRGCEEGDVRCWVVGGFV